MALNVQVKKNLPVISILVTIALGSLTTYFAYRQELLSRDVYELQIAATRADISILVNPASNQNWTFTSDGVYVTINGTLVNEGARSAVVERLELSIVYFFSDGDIYSLTAAYLNPTKTCNWNNDTMSQKEARPFFLTVFVHNNIVVNSNTGQILGIGNSKSDKFGISVFYDDGKGELQKKKDFDAKM